MSALTVYGASDDLVEVEGYIREEFTAYDAEGTYLAFSDGTVLTVDYDNEGVWRFSLVARGSAFEGVDICAAMDDDDYSDKAHFGEGVRWVVYGTALARASQDTKEQHR